MPIKDAIEARYRDGKGVLVLSPDMSNAELASAVRSAMAMSNGADFTVMTHPPKLATTPKPSAE